MKIRHPWAFRLSLGLLLIMVILAVEKTMFIVRAERAISEVTRVTAQRGRCGRHNSRCTKYWAVLRYTVNDEPYYLQVSAGSAGGYNRPTTLATHRVGQRVKVIFEPDLPTKAYRDTFSDIFRGPIAFFVFHLSFLVGSFSEPKDRPQTDQPIELGLNRPEVT